MSTQQAEPTGRAGRYQRSAAGLVVSLVVTVVGIGAILWFMGAFRHDFEAKPETIDYLETVESAQQAGLKPVYPPALPDGWIATGVEVTPGEDPVFMLRMLTHDNRFVAVRQEDSSVTALLSVWVDEEVSAVEAYTVPDDVRRPVARTWKGYADEGGDTAYAAEVGDQTLLVFGSADAAELRAIIDSLVTTPLQCSSGPSRRPAVDPSTSRWRDDGWVPRTVVRWHVDPVLQPGEGVDARGDLADAAPEDAEKASSVPLRIDVVRGRTAGRRELSCGQPVGVHVSRVATDAVPREWQD